MLSNKVRSIAGADFMRTIGRLEGFVEERILASRTLFYRAWEPEPKDGTLRSALISMKLQCPPFTRILAL
jgi:hypothetical protein